ncbi:MAG: hypothetical protein IPN46_19325 [Saprospiraceae bacterium]|nr:hypothetical protein [Saprospiraceae bacterium]
MRVCFLSIAIILLVSCSEEQDLSIHNEKIKNALEKRKNEYKKEILDNCQRDVYEKAKVYVDSLISAEINFQLSDSIVFPPKPIKPLSPGLIVPDTIKTKPIF